MSTTVVSPSATVGADTRYGEFCFFGENVRIGRGCQVGHRVIVHDDTIIDDNVRIDDGAVIGKRPMKAANTAITRDEELPATSVGSRCIIGTNAVVYRGSEIGSKVLIADLATVRERVTVGDFTIVGRAVSIENSCKIGRYVKLETNVYITAYSKIEDRVFVAPGVVTSNDNYVGRTEERFKHFKGVTMKKGARVGVNATILPGVVINEDSLVAAGAVVTADTPARKIVVGVPAKVYGDVPREQLLENQGWED